MRRRATMPMAVPVCVAVCLAVVPPRRVQAQVAVAWNDNTASAAAVGAVRSRRPFSLVQRTVPLGPDIVLARARRGQLAALSQRDGTITLIDRRAWRVRRTIALGANTQPEDIAVVGACRAYVTRRNSARLLRVDLCTGATTDTTDLAAFADSDGNPDLGAMIEHEERLFVQVRRANEDTGTRFVPPAMLAVIDVSTDTLIDADPARPGTQAIELEGTAAKYPMQIVAATRQLFVGASGGFHDAGGIEVVHLDALRSEGLVIREADSMVGADLGPFVMVTPERGYLVYSTDFDLSSHLKPFSLSRGVPPGPDLYVTVGYAVPALVVDPFAGTLLLTDGHFDRRGLVVFDAASGAQLTPNSVPVSGQPTAILSLRGTVSP
jgi:hypothetical protein